MDRTRRAVDLRTLFCCACLMLAVSCGCEQRSSAPSPEARLPTPLSGECIGVGQLTQPPRLECANQPAIFADTGSTKDTAAAAEGDSDDAADSDGADSEAAVEAGSGASPAAAPTNPGTLASSEAPVASKVIHKSEERSSSDVGQFGVTAQRRTEVAREAASPASETYAALPVKQLVPAAPSASPTITAAVAKTNEQPEPAPLVELAATSVSLPWGPSAASPEMAAICGRAEEAARRGFNLAERGALYSARAQFIESLRILAAAQDTQRNTNAHLRALSAGLRALEEVDDFVPHSAQLEPNLNLQLYVDSHRTPVLKNQILENMAVLDAQRMYLAYAQEQLAAAGGDQPVASLALLGLGKICTVPAEMHGPREQIAEAKAVVYHQAAVMVEPKNFLAANELGVLLAHFGKLPEARATLEQAVAMSAGPTEWRNLAAVCDEMSDAAHATEARRQAEIAVARLQKDGYASAGTKYPIEWLDPTAFAGTSSLVADAGSTSTATAAPTSATAPNAATNSTPPTATAAKPQAKGGIWPWLR
ncbi:MAG TPA: hypothetical protein VFE46_03095 [Pirellulales bacterium]|jgi:tetratricopeptide (TPR) repeat protein|nr:hypothetical protein [Pirellulales bacterium]